MKQSAANVGVTSGNGQAGRRKRLAVTPIAGAVRSVLALSGTLLALMGSGAALAGTCDLSAPNTLSCNGDFFNTAPDGPFVPVVDMTLILGDEVPTTVTPLAGQAGVEATWGGNVGVTSFADITTDGASGMLVFGTTSATVDNQGIITTHVSAAGAMALDVYANGDISIGNSGEILAEGTGIYDVTAINAYSSNGDVLIGNLATGTVGATAQDGNAVGLMSFAMGAGTVSNEGAITATSVHGVAIGVLNQTYGGDASVTNSGSITADAAYYQGIGVLASSGNGSARVGNTGSVTVSGGEDQSFGMQASGLLGSDVANSGTIIVNSSAGSIIGALASTYEGEASVSNGATGLIHGYTAGADQLVGMRGDSANGVASVENAGFIQLIGRVGESTIIGMAAYSGAGSTIGNSGYLLAGSYSNATVGAHAVAQAGDVGITNAVGGYVRSVSLGYAPTSSSTGLIAESLGGNAGITNDGRIVALTNHGDGVGLRVRASGGDASADNSGYVKGAGLLYTNAIGMSVVSSTGRATVENSGITVADNLLLLGRPIEDVNDIRGIEAISQSGTTVYNSGLVRASGAWKTRGILAAATYGDVLVANSDNGEILAKGNNVYGIFAEVQYGDHRATVDNAGSIKVIQAGNCYCNATIPVGSGIMARSLYSGGVEVSNSGSIQVTSQHDSNGISALAYFGGNAVVDNSGTIDIFSSGYNSVNAGINANSLSFDVSVVNSGDITIEMAARSNTNYFNVDVAKGIQGDAGATHSPGYLGATPDGGGDVHLVNTGSITILGAQTAYGMDAESQYQQAVLSNSGDISLVSEALHSAATGLFASARNFRYAHDYSHHSPEGAAIVDNSGNISVQAQTTARGIRGFVNYLAGTQITNSGDIAALASGAAAYGVVVASFNSNMLGTGTFVGDDLGVNNSGSIVAVNHAGTNEGDRRGGIKASGIQVASFTNNIGVVNSGDILAEATAGTCDVDAFAYACFGGATVGSVVGILASSDHGAYHGYYTGDVDVVNTGTISALVHSSSSTESTSYAYFSGGAIAAGILAIGGYGDVNATNAGIIEVSAKGEGHIPEGQTLQGWATTAAGMMSSTYGSLEDDVSEIVLANTGSITVSAEAVYADGTALANGIGAQHDTFYYSGYYGIFTGESNGQGIITVTNAGSISVAASVTGPGTGAATANGISAVSVVTNGVVNLANNGRIEASATGPGVVYANGVLGSAASVATALGENSVVVVQATGLSGAAIGLSLNGDALDASNAGILRAEFIGSGGLAYGASITSSGAVDFSNSGHIWATNVQNAVGVALNSASTTALTNTGTITGLSSAGLGIAVQAGASADMIDNSGTITGAVLTNDGEDAFANRLGGLWRSVGSSDFGSGNDTITNAGTIVLDSASIALGDSSGFGNSFTSSGTIAAFGDTAISMGLANTIAFSNTGLIDFRDGAANDILTIAGDFAGDGDIYVDLSGLLGTSDLLYINGSVADGSVNTINVNVLDLPTTASSTAIDMVRVSGNSRAGNFVLGQVNYDPNQSFLTLDFSLLARIDASNATNDAFSLGVNAAVPPVVVPPVVVPPVTPPVTPPVVPDPDALVLVSGLSDSGTLAAAIAPGVQGLLGAQVGTWRQRLGVIDSIARGGVNLWVRLFQGDGTLNPQHHADNFGQGGNFAYDQKNSGTEVGADFAISDNFSVGLLLAKAEAKQDLTGVGAGSSKLDGDTVGAYATWLSGTGFYMDASYRRMDFDARVRTTSGEIRTSGNADAFNLEAGYAWTLDNGLQIEPQLQYTGVRVDGINQLAGALANFESEGGDSSLARLGVAVRKTFQDGSTAWTPYVTLSTVHEFDGQNGFTINDDFSGHTSVEGTHALVEAGLTVDLGRLSLFGGANWMDGGARESVAGGQLGMRFAW